MKLTCNYCHKRGHIRVNCWLRKKKQPDANVELIGEDKNVIFYLLQIDQLVKKIDGLLILTVHNTLVPIGRCSLYTLRFKGEKSSWGILLQAR